MLKALVATARIILQVAWHLLSDRAARFRDIGPDLLTRAYRAAAASVLADDDDQLASLRKPVVPHEYAEAQENGEEHGARYGHSEPGDSRPCGAVPGQVGQADQQCVRQPPRRRRSPFGR